MGLVSPLTARLLILLRGSLNMHVHKVSPLATVKWSWRTCDHCSIENGLDVANLWIRFCFDVKRSKLLLKKDQAEELVKSKNNKHIQSRVLDVAARSLSGLRGLDRFWKNGPILKNIKKSFNQHQAWLVFGVSFNFYIRSLPVVWHLQVQGGHSHLKAGGEVRSDPSSGNCWLTRGKGARAPWFQVTPTCASHFPNTWGAM